MGKWLNSVRGAKTGWKEMAEGTCIRSIANYVNVRGALAVALSSYPTICRAGNLDFIMRPPAGSAGVACAAFFRSGGPEGGGPAGVEGAGEGGAECRRDGGVEGGGSAGVEGDGKGSQVYAW